MEGQGDLVQVSAQWSVAPKGHQEVLFATYCNAIMTLEFLIYLFVFPVFPQEPLAPWLRECSWLELPELSRIEDGDSLQLSDALASEFSEILLVQFFWSGQKPPVTLMPFPLPAVPM